jgi:AcrR family transcriptional regulator
MALISAISAMSVVDLLEALGLSKEMPEESGSDARILDAALFLVGEVGERRLTMDDVAAEAKVGRRTVFRRFGSKEALLQRLYHREVLRAVEHITPTTSGAADVLSALVETFLRLVDYSTSHPVISRGKSPGVVGFRG